MDDLWENIDELYKIDLDLKIDRGYYGPSGIDSIYVIIQNELYDGQAKTFEISESLDSIDIIAMDNNLYFNQKNRINEKSFFDCPSSNSGLEFLKLRLIEIKDKLENGLSIYEEKNINSIWDTLN